MSEQEWEPITDENHILRPGCDQVRMQMGFGSFAGWVWIGKKMGVSVAEFRAASADKFDFRKPVDHVPQSTTPTEQPPAPTPDRGSKYHRTITQTIAGDTHGCSVVVDVYDVLRAFGVSCPAAQHAIKKLLCPGLRGSKSAAQDIEEAASSCRRAIELLEFEL